MSVISELYKVLLLFVWNKALMYIHHINVRRYLSCAVTHSNMLSFYFILNKTLLLNRKWCLMS